MILNDDLEFLWVHVPKAGGVSIRQSNEHLNTDPTRAVRITEWVTNRYTGFVNTDDLDHGPINPGHLPAWAIRDALIDMGELTQQDWDSLDKWAVVRNPWDHMHSLYKFEITNPDHPRHDDVAGQTFVQWIQNRVTEAREIFRRRNLAPVRRRLPEYFTTTLIMENPEEEDMANQWSGFEFLYFDNLNDDWASLAHYLNRKAVQRGLPMRVNPSLPHLNASGPPNDFLPAWNGIPAMIRWAQEIYEPEFQFFGWQPPKYLNVPPGVLRQFTPRLPQGGKTRPQVDAYAREHRHDGQGAEHSA